MSIPEFIENVKVAPKANVYFDGKVVSHSYFSADGQKHTLGLIYPGKYSFNTGKPELMQISAGHCKVQIQGEAGLRDYRAGDAFEVPGNSSFAIEVETGIAEYICSFKA